MVVFTVDGTDGKYVTEIIVDIIIFVITLTHHSLKLL